MKLLLALTLLAPAAAQPSAALFNCGVQAENCLEVQSSCTSDGKAQYCLVALPGEGCKVAYSHFNWYVQDTDASLPPNSGYEETCSLVPSNKGCAAAGASAVGIKINTASSLCVIAEPLTPVYAAAKDRSGCTNTGPNWICQADCACGGASACVYTPTPMNCDVVMDGDPHIKTWNGKWFDYMGACDLKMLSAPKFDGHQDININVRTTLQHTYSYIEAAAVQIGDDVLEVASYGDYAVNGVDTPYLGGKAGRIGGYDLYYTQVNKKKHVFDIVLGPNENITLATYKQLVSVHIDVHEDREKFFGNSEGLLGAFNGDLLARDGTVMQDTDAFGQEWQITDEEPQLFRVAREPQFPAKCVMADPNAATGRRLGQSVSEEAAELACAHKVGAAFNNCVYDVMAIGDLELAEAGSF